jgi:hypothetical protein
MSKKIYVDAFFDQYEGLVEQMIAVFPEDSDWTFYRTGISMFRRTNPMFLVTKTWECVAPYETEISNRDETFFLNYKVTEGSYVDTVSKLRDMWQQLTAHNRSVVWDYITNITYLAKKCAA